MGKFEPHGGFTKDFDFNIGLAEGAWDCKEFGDRLWADVARILEVPFEPSTIKPSGSGGYNYWFESDDLSASLYVADPEPDEGFFGQVPAMLTARSRSDTVETWELAEKLFERLAALGGYLVVVFASNGMPVDANFDIGDDW